LKVPAEEKLKSSESPVKTKVEVKMEVDDDDDELPLVGLPVYILLEL